MLFPNQALYTLENILRFFGIINYYYRLYPINKVNAKLLLDLVSAKVKLKQAKEAQTYFNKIKKLIIHNTLLVYTDFLNTFYLDIDTS